MQPQVNIEYARTMNKVVFDQAVQAARAEREDGVSSISGGGRGGLGSGAALIPIDEDFPREPPRAVPDRVSARSAVRRCELLLGRRQAYYPGKRGVWPKRRWDGACGFVEMPLCPVGQPRRVVTWL